jgi:nucleotide-binding universal stress UspA family protein
MLVSTGVIPFQSLGESPIPVSDVAVVYLGPAGVVAIVFAAIIAAISSSNSSILAASRVIYAMGRDGIVTDWLNISHPRFYTPHRAIAATGGVTTILILVGLEVETIIALLAEAASFSFLVAYSLVHVSLVVFRRTDPDGYDPSFALPRPVYPVVPILGVVLSLVVVSQMATVVVAIGSGIVVLGVVWYAVYARSRVVNEGLLREAIYGPATEPYRVVVPVANPATQRGLLRLAAASAHANEDDGTPELVAVNVVPVAHPSPLQNVEADRAEHQRDLLQNARDVAAAMDVTLRTRSVVAPDVGRAILDVLDEEAADEVVAGWDGTFDHGGHRFGSTVDLVVHEAPCDVSLVALRNEAVGRPVALVTDDANAPSVAGQAVEFASVDETVPTLLNVQSPDTDGPSASGAEAAARERGRAVVDEAADAAGLAPDEYEARVVVADDVNRAVVEATDQYGTVCVGLSEHEDGDGTGVGPVTERVASDVPATVALVRGAAAGER